MERTIDRDFIKKLYWVYLFNLVFVFFIVKEYIVFVEDFSDKKAWLFFLTATVSHFMLLVVLPLLIALLFYLISKRKKATSIIYATLMCLLIIALEIDTEVYAQFRYHLSPIVFSLVFGKRATDIFQFSMADYMATFGFVFLSIGLQFVFHYIAHRLVNRKTTLYFKPTLAFFVLATFIGHGIYAWSASNFYRPVTQFKNVYPSYYPLTATSLLTKLGLVDEESIRKEKELNRSFENNSVNYPLNEISSQPPLQKKNILFVVIDSWRFDCHDSITTPSVFEFSKKAQVFKNHNSGSNMTTGGVFSLMYGIPATYFHAFTNVEKQPVFTKELQKQGYEFKILSSSTLENPPFTKNAFAGISGLRLFSEGETPAERDLDIFKHWTDFIEKRDEKPFFGFVFFDAAHGFDCPEGAEEVFTPTLKKVDYLAIRKKGYDALPLYNRYKNSLHFIDGLVGEIIAQLEQKNLLENTIVVITGDHGQEFDDSGKGYWQHGGNFSKYQIKVPMVVYDFEKKPASHNHLTLHYDLVPTMMKQVLGVQNPFEDYASGQSLYDTTARDWFIAGYNKKYAIVEKERITNVYESGFFESTDSLLNPVKKSVDYDVIVEALNQVGKYYTKTSKGK
ncbi:MAG: DUF3413 domain-containing protein [Flavobacteriaceae bacterium]